MGMEGGHASQYVGDFGHCATAKLFSLYSNQSVFVKMSSYETIEEHADND